MSVACSLQFCSRPLGPFILLAIIALFLCRSLLASSDCPEDLGGLADDSWKTPIRQLSIPRSKLKKLFGLDREQTLQVLRQEPRLHIFVVNLEQDPEQSLPLNPGVPRDILGRFGAYLLSTQQEDFKNRRNKTTAIYLEAGQHFSIGNRFRTRPYFEDRIIIVDHEYTKLKLIHEYCHDLVIQAQGNRARMINGISYSPMHYFHIMAEKAKQDYAQAQAFMGNETIFVGISLSPSTSKTEAALRSHLFNLFLVKEIAWEELESNGLILAARNEINLPDFEVNQISQIILNNMEALSQHSTRLDQTLRKSSLDNLTIEQKQLIETISETQHEIQLALDNFRKELDRL